MTQEKLKSILTYYKDTGEFFWNHKGQGRVMIKRAGTIRQSKNKYDRRRQIRIDGKQYTESRLAWLYMTGNFPVGQIDHEDHDPSNNKWENLREVTGKENAKNSSMRSTNKSGVTGVGWHKKSNKWRATITTDGKTIHLGTFINKDEAIKVRKQAEIKHGFHVNHGN